ncbi:NADP-dependent oxidoreductase domain-containing protein [Plectosphaerella plurivora]|uniref:NADP-dependent oxidoreductase domain-containing protein n=1 Tax=Plectosphaerella plurivora TaxID=936078 RepID=A0A9P8VJP3_9PEZI|nr:NADP-dependent oxidoreductase domain-containing protein [Plectosphaerella plurivora]
MIPSEYFKASSGTVRIPFSGLGTYQPDHKAYPAGSVKQTVLAALRAGYRHIDTSLRYDNGRNEKEVGEAVRESGISREEIFVENVFHTPEDVGIGMDISLKNLGLDYVDMFLMHCESSIFMKEETQPIIDIELSRAYVETWKEMEKLVEQKKARHIGVSNFSSPKIKKLLAVARIKPAMNQIECHPYWPQKGLVKLCQDNDIHISAFGPLGCDPIPAIRGRTGPGPLEDATIAAEAEKYSKTPAQVILCQLLLRGLSVIPKNNNPARIQDNFDYIFDMAEEDFVLIDNLMGEQGERGVRNLETLDYLGFHNYNEEIEEP